MRADYERKAVDRNKKTSRPVAMTRREVRKIYVLDLGLQAVECLADVGNEVFGVFYPH